MENGGKREGAGRPKGRRSRKTLEKLKVQEAFNQRVLKHADALFEAQLALSVGSVRIFRVDEEEVDGKTKRVHTLVTDAEEIKDVLDNGDGGSGLVGDSYYFVTSMMPDNRAVDSMLNRTLGKPKDTIEHSGPNGGPITTTSIVIQGIPGGEAPK